ncbi:unnamed protein product [Spodoptera littoralis]|uniref:Uncharacterized protein n=1 Tax=Spodoptera littoralis TaxID=7109 RepID=A0A9P0I1J0_SPOLI|nr:unnamed protein product [Spodoptera littoralis]CAH1637736.1 unnamed protein product [Spodoptera littoralis]
MDRCINCTIAIGRSNPIGRKVLDNEAILTIIRQWRIAEPELDMQFPPTLSSFHAMALPSFEAELCPDVLLAEQEPDETAFPSILPTDANLPDLLSQDDLEKIYEALDHGWMDFRQKTS